MVKRIFKLNKEDVLKFLNGKKKNMLLIKRHMPNEQDVFLDKPTAIKMVETGKFEIEIDNKI